MNTSDTRFAVDVQGRSRTYWDTAELAVEAAGRAVFASYDTRTAALEELRAGRPAGWAYGFSEVGVYPPNASRSANVERPRRYRLESRNPGPRLTHGKVYEGWPVTDMGLIVQTHDDHGKVFGMIPDAPQAYWDANDNRYDYRFITLDDEGR